MPYKDFSWLFLVLLIVGIFFFRWGGCCGIPRLSGRFKYNNDNNTSEALEILKKRYAQGEINEAEYERMKQKLNEK